MRRQATPHQAVRPPADGASGGLTHRLFPHRGCASKAFSSGNGGTHCPQARHRHPTGSVRSARSAFPTPFPPSASSPAAFPPPDPAGRATEAASCPPCRRSVPQAAPAGAPPTRAARSAAARPPSAPHRRRRAAAPPRRTAHDKARRSAAAVSPVPAARQAPPAPRASLRRLTSAHKIRASARSAPKTGSTARRTPSRRPFRRRGTAAK